MEFNGAPKPASVYLLGYQDPSLPFQQLGGSHNRFQWGTTAQWGSHYACPFEEWLLLQELNPELQVTTAMYICLGQSLPDSPNIFISVFHSVCLDRWSKTLSSTFPPSRRSDVPGRACHLRLRFRWLLRAGESTVPHSSPPDSSCSGPCAREAGEEDQQPRRPTVSARGETWLHNTCTVPFPCSNPASPPTFHQAIPIHHTAQRQKKNVPIEKPLQPAFLPAPSDNGSMIIGK